MSDWLTVNQALAAENRKVLRELSRIRKVVRCCPQCSKKILASTRIAVPEWAKGPDWGGWAWVPKQQFMLRATVARIICISEDCELISDEYSRESYDADTLTLVSHDAALRIASILAENDGGWSSGEYDDDDNLIPGEGAG